MMRTYGKRRTRAPVCAAAWRSLFLMTIGGLIPVAALAHTGGAGTWHDLESGWLHPFTGLDHLLAMLALGLWAGQNGGRGMLLLPAGFVGCMVLGGLLAIAGGALPAIEPVILASLMVFGIGIAAAVRLPDRIAVVAVGGFALFHGAAHGLEMPAAAGTLQYALGFVLATAVLHVAGVALALGFRHAGWLPAMRLAGAGVALTGAVLLFQ